MKAAERWQKLKEIERYMAEGIAECVACRMVGVSTAWLQRWQGRYAAGGYAALNDLPRSGRPPKAPNPGDRRPRRDQTRGDRGLQNHCVGDQTRGDRGLQNRGVGDRRPSEPQSERDSITTTIPTTTTIANPEGN